MAVIVDVDTLYIVGRAVKCITLISYLIYSAKIVFLFDSLPAVFFGTAEAVNHRRDCIHH